MGMPSPSPWSSETHEERKLVRVVPRCQVRHHGCRSWLDWVNVKSQNVNSQDLRAKVRSVKHTHLECRAAGQNPGEIVRVDDADGRVERAGTRALRVRETSECPMRMFKTSSYSANDGTRCASRASYKHVIAWW